MLRIGLLIVMFLNGGLVAWLWFGVLAPEIGYVVPSGPWHNFIAIVINIIIAYFGGIGIPIFFIMAGLYFLIK